jgi:hypothetical protein
MKQDTRCTVFNFMKIMAVLFANFLILKSVYILISSSSISKVEYAYLLLGFIMLLGGTFASSHEFCEDGYQSDTDSKSEEDIIKEEMRRRNSIKDKIEEESRKNL